MPLMIPDTTFYMYSGLTKASTVFSDSKTLVFSVPSTFDEVSTILEYEQAFYDFQELGIDTIYCTCVTDDQSLWAWFDHLDISNVKPLPDGNGDFARAMGMLVDMSNFGMGMRSWRYAMIVAENLTVDKMFIENGKPENLWPIDPVRVSTAETVLNYLKK